jgi:carbon storage regulator CsrA
MLVLSRSEGEIIVLNDDIYITCLGKNHEGEYLFGFDAPQSVQINRLEIFLSKLKKIQKTKKQNR